MNGVTSKSEATWRCAWAPDEAEKKNVMRMWCVRCPEPRASTFLLQLL